MGDDHERGEGASNSPKPNADGRDPVPELSELHSAFDSIDDTMKGALRKDAAVTPEALAQIVSDAVAKAIAEYEQARGLTPQGAAEPPAGAAVPKAARKNTAREPRDPAAVPPSPYRAKIDKLKGDMGLDEIRFDQPRPEPAEKVIQRQLSSQMGVHDFAFDDAPAAAGAPAARPRTEADAIAAWAAPVPRAAPPAAPGGDEMRAPAAAEPRDDDPGHEFTWITAALEAGGVKIEADPPPVTPKPVVHETSRTPEVRETVSSPEVGETRRSLASWFRAALVDTRQEREPAAVPDPGPEAPAVPAAAAAPPAAAATAPAAAAPPGATPPPVAARPESQPTATPDQNLTAKAGPPEEAAKTIFFTFDPILPVPPRLPRESDQPPKKR